MTSNSSHQSFVSSSLGDESGPLIHSNLFKKFNPLTSSNNNNHSNNSNNNLFDFITSFTAATQNSQIIQLLKIEPLQRTDKDCRQIVRLIKDKQYFTKIVNTKIINEISSKLRYKFVQKGQYIYKINQNAQSFYVVIDGYVDLLVPENIQIFNQDAQQSQQDLDIRFTHLSNIQSMISQISMSKKINELKQSTNIEQLQKSNEKPNAKQKKQQQQQKPKQKIIVQDRVVMTVKDWQAFGQVTLNQTTKRAASAVAKQNTNLIQIRKQQYQLINKAQIKTNNRQKFLLLQSLPLFRLVHKYSVQGFVYYMTNFNCQYNRVIFQQDNPINFIYIVVEGQFKLQKTINKRINFTNIKNRKLQKKKNQQLKQVIYQLQKRNTTSSPKKNTKNDIQSLKINTSPQKRLFYKIVGRGQILGDTQCVLGTSYPLYQQNCTCISQTGLLYAIPRKIFLDKLLSPQNQLYKINDYLKNRQENRRKDFGKSYLKHSQDRIFQQYLPIQKRKRLSNQLKPKSKQKMSQQKEHKNMNLTFSTNFFNNFNRTFNQSSMRTGSNRRAFSKSQYQKPQIDISYSAQKQIQRQKSIPSAVKDVVKVVSFKSRYHKMRTQNSKQPVFEFNNDNVPLYIKQKYKDIFKKLGK